MFFTDLQNDCNAKKHKVEVQTKKTILMITAIAFNNRKKSGQI